MKFRRKDEAKIGFCKGLTQYFNPYQMFDFTEKPIFIDDEKLNIDKFKKRTENYIFKQRIRDEMY